MKKGVLFALFVGGMHHDLCGTDNVHVHFHAHLKKEQFGVGLQPVNFQNIRIVGIIHPIQRLESIPVENSPSTIVCSGIPTIGIILLPLKR